MPIYEFYCSCCDYSWEELISYEESRNKCCSVCGKKVEIKPSGFYGKVAGGTPKFYPNREDNFSVKKKGEK